MFRHLKSTSLSLLLILSCAVCASAQTPDTSWIYGIWFGDLNFDEADNRYPFAGKTTMIFRINEKGHSVEFERRPCPAEWVLEEINEQTARFRERVGKPTVKVKTKGPIKQCVDGGTLTFQLSTNRYGRPYLSYEYRAPGSGPDVRPGRDLLDLRLPYDHTPDYKNYFEAKAGGFTYNRRFVYEVEEFGLKIADTKFPMNRYERMKETDVSFTYPLVVAVQEGGPAFYAGVVPGDVIISLGSKWSLNDSSSFMKAVQMYASTKISNLLGVDYAVADSPYVESKFFTLPFASQNSRGRWIGEVPVHRKDARTILPAVRAANEAAKERYAQQQREVLAVMKRSPCRIGGAYISEAAAGLNDLATMTGSIGEGVNRERQLTEIAEAVCANSRDGGLTRLETALLGISLRKIDPCEYSPTKDYSETFDDYDSIKHFSRKGYDNLFGSQLGDLYTNRNAPMTEEQKVCFSRLLRSTYKLPGR